MKARLLSSCTLPPSIIHLLQPIKEDELHLVAAPQYNPPQTSRSARLGATSYKPKNWTEQLLPLLPQSKQMGKKEKSV